MKKRISTIIALFAALAMIMTMSISVFAGSTIGSSTALKKALNNAGLEKSEVKYIDTEYNGKRGIYEVEFTKRSNGREYSYHIGASTGRILEKSVDIKYQKNSSHSKIGYTEARKKVAAFSGISYQVIKTGTCRYEYDDGEGIYEVKFTKGTRRYEYDVLAPTGKIIEYSWKYIG